MTPQTPLPGEPGATVDELGGTTPGRLTPGPTADARRDDPGSGPDLPGFPGEESAGGAPAAGTGRVEPAEAPAGEETPPADQTLRRCTSRATTPGFDGPEGTEWPGGKAMQGRCCSCRDIEDDADPGCVLHGHPAPDPAALARIYDLGVRGLALARAEGDEIRCWHCDRVIRPDEALHVHADGGQARPVCDSCDAMEGDR